MRNARDVRDAQNDRNYNKGCERKKKTRKKKDIKEKRCERKKTV